MTTHRPLEVRPFQDGDEQAILALHNRAFASHPRRSLAHWRWKYRGNASRRVQVVVALEPGGSCVGVYAVVPHRGVLRGDPCQAGQQTDLAVDPEYRNGLAGGRLVVEIGRTYLEAFREPTTELEWGFPEPHLQRVCLAHLQVGVLRDVVLLVRDATPLPVAPKNGLAVEPLARFDGACDELWRRCAPELGAALVRDAQYLNWRYADHPDVRYLLLGARDGADLCGIAVLREGGIHPGVVSIVDWLVPSDDRAAELALLATALEETKRLGKGTCAAWLPLGLSQALRFQREHGFCARGTPFQECYRSWSPGIDRRWLDQNWYQTLGDIDFL